MTTFLTIIVICYFCFAFFMLTPLGAFWIFYDLDNGKPCYGVIILFILAIPTTIILGYLGILD